MGALLDQLGMTQQTTLNFAQARIELTLKLIFKIPKSYNFSSYVISDLDMGNLCSFVTHEKRVSYLDILLYLNISFIFIHSTFLSPCFFIFTMFLFIFFYQKSAPPHTLEDLLNTVPTSDDISVDTSAKADVVIRDHLWLQKFADFLQRRKQEDDLNTLRFMIMIQVT